jgi:RHS repeat-associated protein
VGKTISATTTNYLYDGLNPVQELSGGAPTANLLTGLGVDEYFQRTDVSGPANFLTDALGSTIALTGPIGNTLSLYTYDPFGNTTMTGSSANPYQYTGREDDGTGLYYYRARYYNPEIGRFISEDPSGFSGGSNSYIYAGNSPTNLRDPSGQNPMCVASGLAVMSVHNIGIIGKTLSGRKIDYYAGWSGLGHILTEDAAAFLEGCIGGVALEAALPAAAVLPAAAYPTVVAAGVGAYEAAIPVIGRLPDTAAFANSPGYEVFNPTVWSAEANAAWIQSNIAAGNPFYLASPITEANVFNGGVFNEGFTLFGVELSQILNAGYTWPGSGNLLVPPGP